jgi:uroporphyrinogen-III decarboxylase
MDKIFTPKQLVRGSFESSDLPRLPFIPWIFTHAARLEQVPVRRIYADPTQYTKCLQNAQKLYGYDGIVSSFDSSLEAEICGRPVNWKGEYEAPAVSPDPGFDFARLKNINVENAVKTGRFATVIESVRRIGKVTGSSLALVGVVSGPFTLMASLTGHDPLKDFSEKPEKTMSDIESAAGFLLKVVQVYCQLEMDIIAISERLMPLLPPDYLPRLCSLFSPLLNTIRFYNAFSVLLPGQSSADNLTKLLDLGFDGIVAAGINTDTWQKIKGGRSCVLGNAVPAGLLNSGIRDLQAYLEKYLLTRVEPGVFLTTDSEVPAPTSPENIHLIMNTISKTLRP